MQTNLRSLILAGSLGLAVIAISGCAGPERTSGRAYEDWQVSHRVKRALKETPTYKYEDVKVDTFRGVVQLSGWVNTEDQRNHATDIAKGVTGVTEVINNISLKPQVQMGVTVPTPTGPTRAPGQATTNAPTPPQ